ncbi:hypothetical protein [Cryobacterium sp. BB736]|uniref:hypothetical protein n=1 Tax=Cryobacterium sp. BB736 TaxID=2746963 RepID=UPI0018758C7D|nr:hypothetical protein [Cryobacterium sp. BB736]
MSPARLALRRSLAQSGLIASALAAVALVVATLTGLNGWLDSAAAFSVRDGVASASPLESAIRFETRVDSDASAQASAADQLIADQFGAGVDSWRTLRTDPIEDSEGRSFIFLADPGAEPLAELVSGEWPSDAAGDAIPAALHADAADAAGLAVGDTVHFATKDESVTVKFVGTWRPIDPGDVHWFGDPTAAGGEINGAFGPLLLTAESLAGVPARPLAQWTITPDASQLNPEDLARLQSAIAGLDAAIDDTDGIDTGGVLYSGALAPTLADLDQGIAAVNAVAPIPVILVLTLGWIALVQLARLLTIARSVETTLLRARGTALSQFTLLTALEAGAIGIVGSALGLGIALAITAAVSGPGAATTVLGNWPTAVAVAAASVVVFCVTAWRAARAGLSAAAASGRATKAATIGAIIIVMVTAALSVWQLRLYGSPLITAADGTTRVDPIAMLAPALALAAGAVVGLAVFAPTVALGERLAAVGRALTPVLPARQVARRLSVYSVAVLLVTLAVGTTTLAAFYSASWRALTVSSAELEAGAAMRVAAGKVTPSDAAELRAVDGVASVAPAVNTGIQLGKDSATLLALAPADLPSVMLTVRGAVDPDAIGRALDSAMPGVELTNATGLEVTVDATGAAEQVLSSVSLAVWLMDDSGATTRVRLTPVASVEPGQLVAEGTLPDGLARAHVLAVDAGLGITQRVAVELELVGVRATTPGGAVDVAFDGEKDLSVSSDDRLARVHSSEGTEIVPAVVSQALADRLGLEVGDTVDFRFTGTGRTGTAEIAGTAPLLPGASGALALLVPLPALGDSQLRTSETALAPNELWVTPDAGTDLAALERSITGDVTTATPGGGATVAASSVTAWWIGVAGVLALTVLAVSAIALALRRARSGEVIVLRALGLSSREQARTRSLELVGALLLSVLIGTVVGVGVSALLAGELSRAAVPGVSSVLGTVSAFDAVPWLAAVGLLLVAFAAVVAVYARGVRRQAEDTESREEVR